MKPSIRLIPRRKFETSGWRTITVAHGEVRFPDGHNCAFNVRLQANAGDEGDIVLIAEDLNASTTTTRVKTITLKRRKV